MRRWPTAICSEAKPCGTVLTTREAAHAAMPGRVVGVDVSERMLERARQVTAAERLDNVRYELGDAEVHRFDPAGFDVAISRFGTMFFSDPGAAFANIAAALRPGTRLMLLVWQRLERNEWARAIDAALGDAAPPPPRARTRSRSATPKPPRGFSRAPASTGSASRTSTSRSSTDTTWTPRSRSSGGFRPRPRPSRA
jgi:SAM-dependent methyltransferase